MASRFNSTAYRYPGEHWILAGTLLAVLLVIVVTSGATFCLSAVFIVGFVLLAYFLGRDRHQRLIQSSTPVNAESLPEVHALVEAAVARLQVEPVQVFVARANQVNAYTFGMLPPRVVVVYSGLLRVMDRDEVQFIIGHELGHVRLGHVWLNSLVGGMAGIPSPYAAFLILSLIFRGWSRACEFSADRAGLLACGKPEKARSALLKTFVVTQGARTPEDVRALVAEIERGETGDLYERFGELFSTHPIFERRIKHLSDYIRTAEYQRLQERMNANLAAE